MTEAVETEKVESVDAEKQVGDNAAQEVEKSPEAALDDELRSIFRKSQEEPENKEASEQEPEAKNKEASKDEPKEEQPRDESGKFVAKDKDEEPKDKKAEPPGNLPLAVREKWDALDDDVKEAFAESQNNLTAKMSAQAQLYNGIKPIHDVLTNAVKEMPYLADMPVGQVANEVFELAQYAQKLGADPISSADTLIAMAERFGSKEALMQKLAGETPGQSATAEHALKQMERKFADLEARMTETARAPVEQTVASFAQSKGEEWGLVENMLPAFIETVRSANPDMSPEKSLEMAYDLAVRAHPDLGERVINQRVEEALKAKEAEISAADAAAKEEAAKKASKINVNGSGGGKPTPKTMDEELRSVYRRMTA